MIPQQTKTLDIDMVSPYYCEMDIGKRLSRYCFTPMMVDLTFGLNSLISYLDDYEIGLSDELVMAKYREAIEESKTYYYSVDERPSLLAGARLEAANSQQKKIAIIPLTGTMSVNGGLCTEGIGAFERKVNEAKADPSIVGAIIHTHCGGGEALAAQRAGIAVEGFRMVKPIVQYADFSASGAYLVGAKCNEIIAGGAMSEFGSIGVVIQVDKNIIEYIRENVISIYADGSENKHADLKAILEGKFEILKDKSLNPIRKEFVKIVKAGRLKITSEALTGDMFMAKDALKVGLINSIGTMDSAVNRVITLTRRYNRVNNAKKIQSNYV